ncbi:MAG: GerMN domain-containing protein [Oscillospiraceae bacterium]|nr:GerMN domain-containing protein [Oscillospiraceae bacterium]
MKRLIALLLALALLLSTGCSADEETGIRIYYAPLSSPNDYGQAALDYQLWDQAPESPTPEDLFAQMLLVQEGERTLFPDSLRLLSASSEQSRLTLNFSEDYAALSGISLSLANYALTLTMTQLPGITSVVILAGDRPLPGWGSEGLRASDVLLTGEIRDPVLTGFQLYFPRTDGGGLEPDYQQAELFSPDQDGRISLLLQLLVAGPSDSQTMTGPFAGLDPYLNWRVEDRMYILSLTESWVEVLLSDELVLDALVESLCALNGVDAVVFRLQNEVIPGLEGTFFPSN